MERYVHCRECDKRINVKDAIASLTENVGISDSEYTTYTCIPCHKYIVKCDHNRIRLMELNGETLF